MQSVKSDLQSIFHQYDDIQELPFEEDVGSFDINAQDSTKQSVISDLQSIFHQYDDIQELFFQGDVSSFDINARDSHGKTLLHHACEYGLTEGVSVLLANNAQADICDKKGYAPLHYACQNNHIHYDICKILIKWDPTLTLTQGGSGSGSTVTSQDEFNRKLLHYTCIHGDFDIVDNLLKAGADPCARDKLGNNPMHYACENGHLQCVRQLIATSQNPNGLLQIPNNDGVTPLSMKTPSGGTILHIACENGDVYVAAKLLQAGADTNLSDVFGFTPLSVRTDNGGTILHVACEKGDINLVKKLLKAGADPNVTDEFGFTPLMRAVVSTSTSGITTNVVSSIITALCYSECNVNASFVPSSPSDSNVHYCEGSTALHMAIDERRVDSLCIQTLVDNGAALDARDVHGRTPLHIASMQGHHSLTPLLAPSSKSFHFKDNDGCTPLYYACKNSHVKCIRKFTVQCPDIIGDLMKIANNDGTTPLSVRTDSGGTILHVACDKGDINLVKKLLKAGADPNVTDEFGFTPLMRAVVSTSTSGITTDVVCPIIIALCDSKCNVNATFVPSKPSDSNVHYCEGSTALHMAIDEWAVDRLCVQALVDHGAALDARDVHGRTPLHIASIRGHHPLIKLLAPSPESFHFKDNDGCTPLYYACKNSHLELIRNFIVQAPEVISDLMKIANNDGATPLSVRTGSGGTILHVACDKGDINLVKKLLEAGADPNVTDEFGFTPLMRAVVSTSKSGITTDVVSSIITTLCNSKCSVNASFVPSKSSDSNVHYYEGSTALHMAIDGWADNQLCVQALVDHGAALDARDVHGRTPLHIASMQGHHPLIELLAPSPESSHIKDNDGCTPLYYACKNSHLECIREFLVRIPDVISDVKKVANNDGTTPLSARTGSGGTILHVACDKGDLPIVKKLLEAGAEPNVTDKFGYTPLYYACKNSHHECTQAFFDQCPDITSDLMKIANNDGTTPLSVRTDSGGTILHVVCRKGNINLVKKLLEAGADPNVTDEFGFTPLMRAVLNTSVSDTDMSSIVTILCNSNCNVNATLCCKPSNIYMQWKGTTALFMAVDQMECCFLCVKALIVNGATVDVTDAQGCTPLHIASMRGHFRLIKLLAPSPEYFRFKDNNGCTPLYYACKNSHLEGVREIMVWIPDDICEFMKFANKYGATPLSVRGDNDRTILHVVCKKGDLSVVKKVLEAGADPNVTDRLGCTPLYYACKNSHLECVREFIVQIPDVICDLMKVANIYGTTPLSVRGDNDRTILHVACKKGDLPTVKKVLEAGADPNVTDRFGCTPLYYACENSHLECVREFMVQIPDVICDLMKVANIYGATPLSVRGDNDRTILHVACKKGDLPTVKKVLEAGADPNVTDRFGCTPLYYACENSHLECVREFMVQIPDVICDLMKVANIYGATPLSVRGDNDRTILHVACKKGDLPTVKKVLEAGADPNVTDRFGCTPLYYACENSHLECVREFMVQIPDVICDLMKVANKYGTTPLSVRGGNDRTILHVACEKGDLPTVKKVLEAGADPNVTDRFGCTPLYYACKKSHLECVREFIVQIPDDICVMMKVANKYGATPLSVRTDNDQTILHVACEKGDLIIVKKVLEAGADPNSRDGSTFTPLMLAVQHVDDEEAADIVTILCEFKCNINIQTSHFSRSLTALHLACNLGKKMCVEMLVAKGANLLVRTQGGLTPLHLACEGGYHTLISSLITEETVKAYDYEKHWTPLHYACGCNHFESARRIVVGSSKLLSQIHTEYNLTFNSLGDKDGRTILHHAFLRNDIQFVENLLNLGADPNVQDTYGATPLMSALRCHGSDTNMDLLSLLLSQDWEPDIKDNSGRTALHYSAQCDDIRIPLMLISAGCDVTAVDNHGQTFSNLISKESLQLINKQLLRIDRRHIICVVGYPKCGKTTIIAAFQQAQQNRGTLQRLTARLKFNTRVTLDNCRTSGIDTKVITTKRLGSLIFFDFAGQSEYYASHLAFLESALSAKGSTITFIMMVDLRCSEEDRIAQCKEWLFPIKSISNDHNMLNVILIGSHLDQVGSVSTSTSSLQDTLRELKRTLCTPQMQFIDCWGMDCRQLSSKGMTNLQHYLQATHPVHSTSAEASQVPLGACLLFYRLKKSEKPPLAITPSKIIDKLKNGRPPIPLTVKYIDSCCQDLAASGLVLYIPNREDTGESWLILEMEEILSRIHGKLFAPDSAEFPMHHKNLANQFGLVHVEELTLAFKDSPLDPELVRKLLMAMEFCHPVDSSLMTEGILDGFFLESKFSCDLQENLLFFPSLVKANEEPVVLSTESDIPGDDCHRVCWELSTVKPHFLHPRFQQAVFIRLACNHVQKHKSDLSIVEEHSCTVSKNAMSWTTIHGVDVCIEIMHKSTIKVLARGRPGVKVSSLMELLSCVVSDVLTVRANHAPGVDAYSVFRVMEKGTPGEHTVPVSSIIDVVQAGGRFVNSRERPPKPVLLKDLFLDWEMSVTLLEKMVSISKINHDVQSTTEDVSEDTHSGPVMIDEHYYDSELHFSFIYLGFMWLFIFTYINRLPLFQLSIAIEDFNINRPGLFQFSLSN